MRLHKLTLSLPGASFPKVLSIFHSCSQGLSHVLPFASEARLSNPGHRPRRPGRAGGQCAGVFSLRSPSIHLQGDWPDLKMQKSPEVALFLHCGGQRHLLQSSVLAPAWKASLTESFLSNMSTQFYSLISSEMKHPSQVKSHEALTKPLGFLAIWLSHLIFVSRFYYLANEGLGLTW